MDKIVINCLMYVLSVKSKQKFQNSIPINKLQNNSESLLKKRSNLSLPSSHTSTYSYNYD